ncbi:MAG: hypothetical protein ACOYUB_03040 [Patescibacteria group bacterium]
MFYTLVAANILMIGTFLLKLGGLPPQLPLFYTRPWGEEQLVDFWVIFILPIIVNVLYFLNEYFYKKFFSGNTLVRQILEYLSIFITISLAFVFVRIIFLVS